MKGIDLDSGLYTLSIVKPDAVLEGGLAGVLGYIIQDNFDIVAQKMIRMDQKTAEQFYIEHAARPFYGELVEFMSCGPVVVQVLKRENAVEHYRKLMGATNPKNAEQSTIRASHGINVLFNAVHGSDSIASAKREIEFFFNENEFVHYDKAAWATYRDNNMDK